MRKAALKPIAAATAATALIIFALAFSAGVFTLALLGSKWAFDSVPTPPSRPTDYLPTVASLWETTRAFGLCAGLALLIGLPAAFAVDRLGIETTTRLKVGPPLRGWRLLFRDIRAGAYLFSGASLALTIFIVGLLASRYLASYFVSVHDLIPPSVSEALLDKGAIIFGLATVIYFSVGLVASLICRETQ